MTKARACNSSRADSDYQCNQLGWRVSSLRRLALIEQQEEEEERLAEEKKAKQVAEEQLEEQLAEQLKLQKAANAKLAAAAQKLEKKVKAKKAALDSVYAAMMTDSPMPPNTQMPPDLEASMDQQLSMPNTTILGSGSPTAQANPDISPTIPNPPFDQNSAASIESSDTSTVAQGMQEESAPESFEHQSLQQLQNEHLETQNAPGEANRFAQAVREGAQAVGREYLDEVAGHIEARAYEGGPIDLGVLAPDAPRQHLLHAVENVIRDAGRDLEARTVYGHRFDELTAEQQEELELNRDMRQLPTARPREVLKFAKKWVFDKMDALINGTVSENNTSEAGTDDH